MFFLNHFLNLWSSRFLQITDGLMRWWSLWSLCSLHATCHEAGEHCHHHLGFDFYQIFRQRVHPGADLPRHGDSIPNKTVMAVSTFVQYRRRHMLGWHIRLHKCVKCARKYVKSLNTLHESHARFTELILDILEIQWLFVEMVVLIFLSRSVNVLHFCLKADKQLN